MIENEFIDIIGGIVCESITKNLVDTSPFFSLIANEFDPISNQQVLCVCFRYLKYDADIPTICESVIDMSYIERGTSESLWTYKRKHARTSLQHHSYNVIRC